MDAVRVILYYVAVQNTYKKIYSASYFEYEKGKSFAKAGYVQLVSFLKITDLHTKNNYFSSCLKIYCFVSGLACNRIEIKFLNITICQCVTSSPMISWGYTSTFGVITRIPEEV